MDTPTRYRIDSDPNCHLDEDDAASPIQARIVRECATIRDLLLEKNRRYGNSALEPLRLFSHADPVEQIKVRIDDKLSRIRTATVGDDEDPILDLIGYLILLRLARACQERPA
jgi:hypothetical protein